MAKTKDPKIDRLPMIVKDVRFKTETVDEEERKVVVLSLLVNPINKRIAEVLAPGVTGKVFNGDAKPADDFQGVEVKLHSDLVTMDVRRGPDTVRPALSLLDVQLGSTLKFRSEDDHYTGALTASFRYPEAKDLLALANAVGTQAWFSMTTQQGKLLEE